MQCAYAILSSVARPTLKHFSTKLHDLNKKVIEHTMCILIFSTTFVEIFSILRRTEQDIKKVY